MVATVLGRHEAPGPPLWLRQSRWRAQSLQELGAEASESRMQSLRRVDERRVKRIVIAEAEQRAKDRRAIQVVLVSAGIFLILVVMIALLS